MMREAGVRGGDYVHPGGEVGVTGTSDLSFFPFTHAQRREQDRRLQPVIAAAWEQEGGPAWWRRVPEVKETHQRLAQSYRVEGTQAWADYVELVLGMTWAATGYFAPVDFWPFVPPPVPLDQGGHTSFRDILNGQRLVASVFSLDNLRANKHYGLLLAHLIWCPDHIDDAAQLMAPLYPWPLVLKQDEVGILRLERQEDIGDSQWAIAERIERRLFRDAKQTHAYGVSASAAARRQDMHEKMARVNRATGRAITHAYDAILSSENPPKDIIEELMRDPAIEDAYSLDGVKMPLTPRKIRKLHKEDCTVHGRPLPRPGRPSKRSPRVR